MSLGRSDEPGRCNYLQSVPWDRNLQIEEYRELFKLIDVNRR